MLDKKRGRPLSSSGLALDIAAAGMLMAKKTPIAIYELLFKEGGTVAKKDVHMPDRREQVEKNVPHPHVMKAMQSSQITRLHKGTMPGDISTGPLPARAAGVPTTASACLRRTCLPLCTAADLGRAAHGPKVRRESHLPDSQQGK